MPKLKLIFCLELKTNTFKNGTLILALVENTGQRTHHSLHRIVTLQQSNREDPAYCNTLQHTGCDTITTWRR